MTHEPIKPEITYEEFSKVDLRVAVILEATPVENTAKLICLNLDLGFEKRTIIAGIKEHYLPENLIGKQIIIVANLAPRKMRGIESHGMLLAGSSEDSTLNLTKLALVTTSFDLTPGTSLH